MPPILALPQEVLLGSCSRLSDIRGVSILPILLNYAQNSNELVSKRGIILEGFSYLSKPFDIDKLISMIDDLLNNDF